MNAHNVTFQDLADVLTGTKRTAQTVTRVKSWNYGSPFGPRHIVLVTPEGEELGTYYECSAKGLDHLRAGMSPEDAGLEPSTAVDDDEDEFLSADSKADYLYDLHREGV